MPTAPASACLLCGGPARVRPFTDAGDDPVSFLVCLSRPRGCGAYEVTGGFLLAAAAWRTDDPMFPRLADYVRRENAQGRVPRLSDQTWRARVTSSGGGLQNAAADATSPQPVDAAARPGGRTTLAAG